MIELGEHGPAGPPLLSSSLSFEGGVWESCLTAIDDVLSGCWVCKSWIRGRVKKGRVMKGGQDHPARGRAGRRGKRTSGQAGKEATGQLLASGFFSLEPLGFSQRRDQSCIDQLSPGLAGGETSRKIQNGASLMCAQRMGAP
jgi:hypothetical protein